MVSQKKKADRIIAVAKRTKTLCLDVEHEADIRPYDPGFQLAGCGFAVEGYCCYLTDEVQCKRIIEATNSDEFLWITWNGKYDWSCFIAAGWLKPSHKAVQVDGLLCLNLLEEDRIEYGLKPIVKEFYGHRMSDYETAASFGLDSPEFEKYGKEDVHFTLKLWEEHLKPKLEEEGLMRYALSIPAVKAFGEMELTGMPWDVHWGVKQIRKVRKKIRELQKRMWDAFGPVNPNSAKQLEARLRQLGYPVDDPMRFPRTDSGQMATSKDAILKIAQTVPEMAPVSNYVTAKKILGTYISDLTLRSLREGGFAHCRFPMHSKTGRTRSADFNAQNIPAQPIGFLDDLHVRAGFKAPEGWTWVTSDLSQIELRLVAHVTQDKSLLAAYRNWECTQCGSKGAALTILHSCPKCGCAENEAILKDKSVKGFWHGLDIHQMTCDRVPALKGNRRIGKEANFAQVYGAGPMRMHMAQRDNLAKYGGDPSEILSPEQWKPIIAEWMRAYNGVPPWHRKVGNTVAKGIPVRDIFGRKRRLSYDGISEDDWGKRKHVLNQAVNFAPQASGCGIAMLGIQKFREEMIERKVWMAKVRLLAFIHDEFSLLCKDSLAEKVSKRLQWHLEHAVKLRVPVRSDRQLGRAWSDTH